MNKLLEREKILKEKGIDRPAIPINKPEKALPKGIAPQFIENVAKAAVYFGIGEPQIIFRGDRRTNRIHVYQTDFQLFEKEEAMEARL